MSNDAPDTSIFDATQKTNLLNILSMEAIQKLPKVAIIPAELSPEEYQNKHQIPLSPAIQKLWSEHGNVEFSNFFRRILTMDILLLNGLSFLLMVATSTSTTI